MGVRDVCPREVPGVAEGPLTSAVAVCKARRVGAKRLDDLGGRTLAGPSEAHGSSAGVGKSERKPALSPRKDTWAGGRGRPPMRAELVLQVADGVEDPDTFA